MNFQEWAESNGLSYQTIKTYQREIDHFCIWWKQFLGEDLFKPETVTQQGLQNYKKYLINQSNKKGGKLSPKTVNKKMESLRTYFFYCKDQDIIPNNPMEQIKPIKIQKRFADPRWLNRNEKNNLFRVLNNEELIRKNSWKHKRMVAIVYLMLHGGLRRSEVVQLEVSDLDFKKKIISVREGKGGKSRIIPFMTKELNKALVEWLDVRGKQSTTKLFTSIHTHIAQGEKTNEITISAINYLFIKLQKLTGIEDLTPHSLRHTFANDLISEGHKITVIQSLLGHEDVNSSMIYASASNQEQKTALKSLSYEADGEYEE